MLPLPCSPPLGIQAPPRTLLRRFPPPLCTRIPCPLHDCSSKSSLVASACQRAIHPSCALVLVPPHYGGSHTHLQCGGLAARQPSPPSPRDPSPSRVPPESPKSPKTGALSHARPQMRSRDPSRGIRGRAGRFSAGFRAFWGLGRDSSPWDSGDSAAVQPSPRTANGCENRHSTPPQNCTLPPTMHALLHLLAAHPRPALAAAHAPCKQCTCRLVPASLLRAAPTIHTRSRRSCAHRS